MLDNIGEKLKGILLVAIVVILVLVMGLIGFSQPNSQGCGAGGATYAAQVYDSTILKGEFEAAYALPGFDNYPPMRARSLRLKELTLQGLIERELLAHEGQELGFSASEEEVMRRVMRDQVILLGGPVDAPEGYPAGELPQRFTDENGNPDADLLRRFIQYGLHRSVEEFVEWQRHEIIAQQVREMVLAGVSVSPAEVHDAYVQETDRAQLAYARFDPTYFSDRVEMDDEAIRAWMGEHTEEVDEEFERQRHRYTDLPEQVRARHILIGSTESEEPAERERKRLEALALLQRAQAGEDFELLAHENSTDTGSAQNGGDLGWFQRGRRLPPFEEAAFEAEPNTIVAELVESQFGFHIIKVEGRREGDVPVDDAKRELAEDLYRRDQAGVLARSQADRALAYLAEGHSMDELDERLAHDWAEIEVADADAIEGESEEAAEEEEVDEPPRDPRAPQVRETLSFSRADAAIPGPFDSGPLTRAAFEMTMDAPLAEEAIELGDSFFVYRLIERQEATEEGFDDETRERLESRLRAAKGREVLSVYIGELRREAESRGALRRNESVLEYRVPGEDDEEDDGERTAAR